MRSLHVQIEKWPLATPLRDASGLLVELEVILCSLTQGSCTGRGEAAGVYYLHDDVPRMLEQIDAVRARVEGGVDREALMELLPPGGARNALDCALWDLEAKLSGRAAWQLAGLNAPRALLTTYTISADEPDVMAASAADFSAARAIKLKLTGDAQDAARVHAVRDARPDVWLGVDANQAFSPGFLEQLVPDLLAARVALIEQPFPVGDESALDDLRLPIPVAADESAQDLQDLAKLEGRFAFVNIKLDKCGGLTAALSMAREARARGFRLMVGNMTGTVLAMAPAFLLGQQCEIVDLDGPLFFRTDRTPAAVYDAAGRIWCPEAAWGGSVQ